MTIWTRISGLGRLQVLRFPVLQDTGRAERLSRIHSPGLTVHPALSKVITCVYAILKSLHEQVTVTPIYKYGSGVQHGGLG